VLSGFVALSFVVFATGPENTPEVRQEKSWPVSVMVAKPEMLAPNLQVFGMVQTEQVSSLKTSIAAPVKTVFHHEGDNVKKGELLMQLDDDELILAVKVAKAELQNRKASLMSTANEYELAKKLTVHEQSLNNIAQLRLKRQLELYNQSMVSNALVDEARRSASESTIQMEQHNAMVMDFPNKLARRQAEVDESMARLEKSQLDLAQTRIVAPFNGYILSTSVSEGDRVVAGISILQIAGSDQLEVRAALPLRSGASLRKVLAVGGEVQATGAVDGEKVAMHLERLSSSLKHGQSGVDAFFTLVAGYQPNLGRVISIDISMPREANVIPIPIQALYEGNRIYRINNRRLEHLDVDVVGDFIDGAGMQRVLVRTSEVKQGDTLLTTQLPRAITGLLVDPIDAGAMMKLQVMK